MKKQRKYIKLNPDYVPDVILIDEEEQEWRLDLIDKVLASYEEQGSGVSYRLAVLFSQFVEGQFDEHELTRRAVAPHLN